MTNMKKSPLGYLLFTARTFLVLTFLSVLATAVVGYCVLPDQIVERAYPDGEIGLFNAKSKEWYLGALVGMAFVLFLILYLLPSMMRRFRRPKGTGESVKYWERDENFALGFNIGEFWLVIVFSFILLNITVHIIRLFPVNLSVPRQGTAQSSTPEMFLIAGIPLLFFILHFTTLAAVKWFRERISRNPTDTVDGSG